MARLPFGGGSFLTLSFHLSRHRHRRAAFRDAPRMPWLVAHIASVTVVTECANTRDAPNALKARLVFALPTAEGVDVRSQVATRVLGISSFARLMVVESAVDLTAATSQLWGALVCALPMAVADVA
jgi:hypothetical protein